ncbi:hypothetical protein FALBO_11571 [Fusarium albosuccineum]|uniref:Uncharacterized protein n=1 Tax=Fusarium albosuccineum TaxID=1237068 RepID=A0A8H4P8T4_9HYPO|nr:hypothetical protein FALBO_11571 [Fusarium albosuccineum]
MLLHSPHAFFKLPLALPQPNYSAFLPSPLEKFHHTHEAYQAMVRALQASLQCRWPTDCPSPNEEEEDGYFPTWGDVTPGKLAVACHPECYLMFEHDTSRDELRWALRVGSYDFVPRHSDFEQRYCWLRNRFHQGLLLMEEPQYGMEETKDDFKLQHLMKLSEDILFRITELCLPFFAVLYVTADFPVPISPSEGRAICPDNPIWVHFTPFEGRLYVKSISIRAPQNTERALKIDCGKTPARAVQVGHDHLGIRRVRVNFSDNAKRLTGCQNSDLWWETLPLPRKCDLRARTDVSMRACV